MQPQSHFRIAMLSLVCIAAVMSASSRAAFGQTEKPPTHAEMYARISESPLYKAELVSTSGQPLTDREKAEIEIAKAAHDSAEAMMDKGDYDAAAENAKLAVEARASILGPRHFMTVSSVALLDTAKKASALSADRKAKFTEAWKALAEWEALNEDGRYEAARDNAQKALDFAEAELDKKHPMIPLSHLRLGTTLIDLGDYTKAEAHLKKAKEITAPMYGTSHPRYADVMDRMGWVGIYLAGQGAFSMQRAEAAADDLKTAVQIYRATLGETADTAESMDNLGTALLYIRKIPEALDTKLRALFIRESVMGPESRDTAVSLSNLAWLYSRIGLQDEVLPLRERALAIFKKKLRPDHPYVYLESANVAWDYHLAGRDDDAIELFKSLIKQDEGREEKARPDIVQRRARLAEIYIAASRYDQAPAAMKQAESAVKNLWEAGYRVQAINTLASIARSAKVARMYGPAKGFYKQVCDWTADPKGESEPSERALYLTQLGSVLLELGEAEQAKSVLNEALKAVPADTLENRTRRIEPLIYLSRAETLLGNHQEAVKHADRAVQLAEARGNKADFSTAFPQLWLGRAYSHAGNTAMAQFCLNDANRTFDNLKDRDPTGSIVGRIEMGNVLAREDKPDAAVTKLKEALAICREVDKERDNVHLDAMKARVLRRLSDISKAGKTPSTQRDEWKQEAVAVLRKLEANQLLDAEEKAWLKANG